MKKKQGRPAAHPSGKTRAQRAADAGVSEATIKRRDAAGEIEDSELLNAKRRAEIVKLSAEGDRQVRLLEIIDEAYIPRKVAEDDGAQIAFVVGELIQEVRCRFGPMLDGLSAAEIDEKLQSWADSWEERLKDEGSKIWERAREAIVNDLRGDMRKAAQKRR